MAVYQDKERKTWYCKFYYTDYTGEKKQKKKSGFKLKREAQEWERNFLEQKSLDTNILFKNFIPIYYEDIENRLKQSSISTKKCIIGSKILPYFGEMPLSEISPVHIRKWQNELLSYEDANNHPYEPAYLRNISKHLSAVFNYAVRYYGLKENPVVKAGTFGKKKSKEMQIWTFEQFQLFISNCQDDTARMAFSLLYFTGIRCGELLALTWNDVDTKNSMLYITKTHHRINKQDLITEPKTPKSNRKIALFPYLVNLINTYREQVYNPNNNSRIFEFSSNYLRRNIKKIAISSNLTPIRVHDLRHSHASLLIEMGFSPLLIAERLGHEKVETTLNTYAHLYPNKHSELADALQQKIQPLKK